MQELSSENFEKEVLKNEELNLVDFWAPWCPWCRRLTPILNSLESEYKGKMSFNTLNTEDYPDLASKYGVMSLPTMKFFCGGREVADLVGYMPENKLRDEFEKVIVKSKECLSQSSTIK